MNPYKLLIVDDEWMVSDSLRTMEEWQERNIEVIGTASNGEEAIQRLETEHVDFMITDIQMPDMDGLQLLQHVYENNPGLQVVVISGHTEFSYAHTALKYKAKGYVLKPLDTDELLGIIDEMIAAHALKGSAAAEPEPVEAGSLTYQESVVQRAKTFIQAHLDQPISLADAAEEVHLTAHYFGQMFKAVTGETYLSYLTKMRMDKACELLKNPELKLYDICRQVGYVESNYFSKVFYKTKGQLPKEFRQEHFNGQAD
ncbi:response regulator [Paenibacillus pasadenensis]|uniref:response regulator transcription factor n=1 Tax=Paenibacillus pasadenensis TaxID=217090 RepID=UPI00203AD7B2|nr:response regulator [Paenibacillus pasadenensis]MCM3746980.1 response regulator [Paenibacillus pasadenensis]